MISHAHFGAETRPYNQGARLTAYELVHDGLPATLLCDSAAAALMAQGKVDAGGSGPGGGGWVGVRGLVHAVRREWYKGALG